MGKTWTIIVAERKIEIIRILYQNGSLDDNLPGLLMSGYNSFYLCAAIAVESLGEEPDPLSTES